MGQRRTATFGRDLQVEYFLHIGSCGPCQATMWAAQERRLPLPPCCDVGRSLSWRWLQYRASQGDAEARAYLDQLHAMGSNHRE